MIYTKETKKALKLCFEAHKDQLDKSGMPYVFHPFHLAESMDDEVSTVAALLHDVVEDTECTFEDLESMGFPKESIEAVRLLTHGDDEPYFDYVRRVKKNETARKVKMADLRHNSDLTRLENPDAWALKRQEKYLEAIKILSE